MLEDLRVKWTRYGRDRAKRIIFYDSLLQKMCNARYVGTWTIDTYIKILKGQMNRFPLSWMPATIEKLEKLNPKTKICTLSLRSRDVYFMIEGFEDKERIRYDDNDFYLKLLSSKPFWQRFKIERISIEGKDLEPLDNGVEALPDLD